MTKFTALKFTGIAAVAAIAATATPAFAQDAQNTMMDPPAAPGAMGSAQEVPAPPSSAAPDAATPATPADPATPAQPSMGAEAAATAVTDTELKSFAEAAMAVQKIQADTTVAAADKQAKMAAEVQSSGLTAQRFNEISTKLQTDAALQKRLQVAMAAEMQAGS
ncbi:DUF4168 domain-containing protein [Croceicoccus mobilis]|uniref:DUF4168 domain-containing protein n=1 Tax=Croceicoccus mobilis TaxID=1703339 RepID=A0A917DSL5_9SPHN|nr:DUF4168 domain-containing protein [Croceicoccus mobilis]GGD66233.1 hypothetical protein GCM10010990_14670 [Croceicoccus mobilis]